MLAVVQDSCVFRKVAQQIIIALQYHVDHPCLVIRGSTEEDVQGKGELWKPCCLSTSRFKKGHAISRPQKIPEQESIVDIPPVLPKLVEPPPKSPPPVVFVLPKPPVFAVEPKPVPVPADKIRVSDGFALIS
jgi:hypothetical protein